MGQGHHDSLAPHGKGPYPVALTSPVAVKVAGVTPWILHTRVKRAYTMQTQGTPSRLHKRTPLIPVKPRSS